MYSEMLQTKVTKAETITEIIGMMITATFIENSSSSVIDLPQEKHGRFARKKMRTPADILSRKLQTPKTKAPDSPLLPITSEMRLIPVERIIDWERPIMMASGQMQSFVAQERKQRPIREVIQSIVPRRRVLPRPIVEQRAVNFGLIRLEEKQMSKGTKATEKGTVSSPPLLLEIFKTLIRQKGKNVPKILLLSLTHIQQTPNRQNFGFTNQYLISIFSFFSSTTTTSSAVLALSSIVDCVRFFFIFLSDSI